MRLHEIQVYNKPLLYIGAILGFIGTYLDTTNKSNELIIYALLISGLILMLFSFKKPKEREN